MLIHDSLEDKCNDHGATLMVMMGLAFVIDGMTASDGEMITECICTVSNKTRVSLSSRATHASTAPASGLAPPTALSGSILQGKRRPHR